MDPRSEIEIILGKGGVLARRLAGFRERPGQLRMAESVAAAFSEESILAVEAPTGIGKSLAYLVPAILGPIARGERVVVSTHTIALQDQLLEKDLPLLAACLPVEFVAQKAVGRSNYLGLRRMHQALAHAPTLVVDDDLLALRQIAAWSKVTGEGLRGELSPSPLLRVWEEVQSESDNCLGRMCPHHQDCFAFAARRRVESANLLIANHALVIADLVARRSERSVLPQYDVLIVDEAHHLAEVAADQLGIAISRKTLLRFLGRLGGREGRGGMLARWLGSSAKPFEKILDHLRVAASAFFDDLDEWRSAEGGQNGRYRTAGICADPLSGPLNELAEGLSRRAEVARAQDTAVELESFAARGRGFSAGIQTLLTVADRELVYWVESEPERGQTALVARPLSVADTLEKELFQPLTAAVLTSATLSIDGAESGLRQAAAEVGAKDVRALILRSPYRLKEQVRAIVARGMPPPEAPEYGAQLVAWILAAVEHTGGGAFLLFTSYRSLDAAWRQAVGPLERSGRLVLRQGPGIDRAGLLDRFRKDGHAVLFGTESFWEGVDVPGSALRLVIITRLPFPVPTTPLYEARRERLATAGRDAFRELSLPAALLKFRQGFGRLIRSEDDRGIFLCLDSRVSSKPYGRKFLASLDGLPFELLEGPDFRREASPE